MISEDNPPLKTQAHMVYKAQTWREQKKKKKERKDDGLKTYVVFFL